MKPVLIWILGLCSGALCGWLAGLLTDYTLPVTMAAGIILGSSIAITVNMQRRKYRKLREKQEGLFAEREAPDSETDPESGSQPEDTATQN